MSRRSDMGLLRTRVGYDADAAYDAGEKFCGESSRAIPTIRSTDGIDARSVRRRHRGSLTYVIWITP